MEIGVLFSTANARSVRRSPACMHKDACATRQLHCQWCSGRRYATLAANAVSVHQLLLSKFVQICRCSCFSDS